MPATDLVDETGEREGSSPGDSPSAGVEEGLRGMDAVLDRTITLLDSARQLDAARAPLSTGLPAVDALLEGGLRPGQLTIVVGRRASDLALNVAHNALRLGGPAVVVFAPTMTEGYATTRLLAITAAVPVKRLREGSLDTAASVRVAGAADALREMPLHVDGQPGMSLTRLVALVGRIQGSGALGLIVVDAPALEGGDVDLCADLKRLAQLVSVPVLLATQYPEGSRREARARLQEAGDHLLAIAVSRKPRARKLFQPAIREADVRAWRPNIPRAMGEVRLRIDLQTGQLDCRVP